MLCLPHHCIWGSDHLLSSFTGLQIEWNFPQEFVTRVSTILDLDDEIWDFGADVTLIF